MTLRNAAGRRPTVNSNARTATPVKLMQPESACWVVDDHRVMRQGLIRLISGLPDIQVMGEAAGGREALEKVRQLQPDMVIMDISMPEMGGVEATRRIKAEFPDVRVIGLSMFEDEQIRTMRHAGAETLLSKTISTADLLKAIYGFLGREEGHTSS